MTIPPIPLGSSIVRPRVDALFAEVRRASVLHPDAQMDTLSTAARDDVYALLDAHSGALDSLADTHERTARLSVTFTRSRTELCAVWSNAWSDNPLASKLWWGAPWSPLKKGEDSAANALSDAMLCALGATMRGVCSVPLAEREALDRVLRVECHDLLERSSCDGDEGIEELLGLELSWRMVRDDASPWEPLWTLWERGAWPVWLGGRSWIVYVPFATNERAVLSEETSFSAVAVRNALRDFSASSLIEAGLGPVGRGRYRQRAHLFDERLGCSMPVNGRMLVGRIASNEHQIALEGPMAPRRLYRIEYDDMAGYRVVDLGAPNGLYVNRTRTRIASLEDASEVFTYAFTTRFRSAPELESEESQRELAAPGLVCLFDESVCPLR